MNSSIAERSTRMRERAQQSWPALPKTASGAEEAAASRSESPKITLARLAAELEGDPLDGGGSALGDPAPDLGRAREGDLGDVGVLDHAAGPQTLPGPATTLSTPSGTPGLERDLLELDAR